MDIQTVKVTITKNFVQKKLTTDITEMSVFMNVCLGTMCMQGLKRLGEGVRVQEQVLQMAG